MTALELESIQNSDSASHAPQASAIRIGSGGIFCTASDTRGVGVGGMFQQIRRLLQADSGDLSTCWLVRGSRRKVDLPHRKVAIDLSNFGGSLSIFNRLSLQLLADGGQQSVLGISWS